MPKSEVVDVEVRVCAETEMAYKVESERTHPDRVWVPKSEVELERKVVNGRDTARGTLTLPRWMAEEKGLV